MYQFLILFREIEAIVHVPVPDANNGIFDEVDTGLLNLNATPTPFTHRVLPGVPGAGLMLGDVKHKVEVKNSTPMAVQYAPSGNLVPLKSTQRSGSLYQLKECKKGEVLVTQGNNKAVLWPANENDLRWLLALSIQ